MPDPNFKVGDRVVYEINSDHLPRWNFSIDNGGTGKFAEGTVMEIHKDTHSLEIVLVNGNYWQWPLEGASEYDPNQWERPGYLRLKNFKVAIDGFKKIETRWDNLFEE